jgi:hypothetical protein
LSHGLKVIRSSDPDDPGDDDGSGGLTSTTHQPKSSPKKQANKGSLLTDATSSPVHIRYSTDL